METLDIISKVFGSLGAIGLFVVIIVFWKLGFFDKGDKESGLSQTQVNQNNRTDIKQLYDHAAVANEEMGSIKTDVAVIKTELGNMGENMRDIKEDIKEIKNIVTNK